MRIVVALGGNAHVIHRVGACEALEDRRVHERWPVVTEWKGELDGERDQDDQ